MRTFEGYLLSTIACICAGSAWAGTVGVPLPLAGMGGPAGLALGAAAYLAYRFYRRNDRR